MPNTFEYINLHAQKQKHLWHPTCTIYNKYEIKQCFYFVFYIKLLFQVTTEATKCPKHHISSFLTYDLSIRAEYGCVLPDRGAGWYQTNSLPGRLGFDLRYDDISSGEILGLTPALSLVSNINRVNRLAFKQW